MSFNELLKAFGFEGDCGAWRCGPHAVATVAGSGGMWKYVGPAGVATGIDKEGLASFLRKLKLEA